MATIWQEVRSDFPAAVRRTYLNAAAASPVPRPVRDAVQAHYAEIESDGDLHWDRWLEERERTRRDVAALVGATPEEIGFVTNASAGINQVIDLLAGEGAVVTDELEFPTLTLPWVHRGVDVHYVPAVDGIVLPEAFADTGGPAAATHVVSHVQFSNGCRQDLDRFGALKARRRLVVGASQSAGVFPIDVRRSRVDALVASGHKWLCAGYGAGFAFIDRAVLERFPPRTMGWLSAEQPFAFDNRSYRLLAGNQRIELGCPSIPTIVALGAAVRYWGAIGIEAVMARALALTAYLRDGLVRAGVDVRSPGGAHMSAQTLCRLPAPGAAAAFLQARDIVVSEKPEGVRIATHAYNDDADVERCVAAIEAYCRTCQGRIDQNCAS